MNNSSLLYKHLHTFLSGGAEAPPRGVFLVLLRLAALQALLGSTQPDLTGVARSAQPLSVTGSQHRAGEVQAAALLQLQRCGNCADGSQVRPPSAATQPRRPRGEAAGGCGKRVEDAGLLQQLAVAAASRLGRRLMNLFLRYDTRGVEPAHRA